MKPNANPRKPNRRRAALNLAAGSLWYLPARFTAAGLLGADYALRCVLFHHISDSETSFTQGLGVTTSHQDFESALKFLTQHYTPVSLDQIIADRQGQALPSRPVLVTFDDAYASIRELAAPLCAKYK
ncbi:MAG TPA: hypothetical protein VF753_19860, partial [Terriglobales bacterium]